MPSSPVSRRNLLGAAAAAPLLAAPFIGAAARGRRPAHRRSRVPLDRISVQLYTLRDQLGIDLAASLAELRAIGYTRVEHAGFVGRTAAQFRAALDAAGLKATSGHVGHPAAVRRDRLAAGPRRRQHRRQPLHRPPVLRHRRRHRPPIRDGAVYHAFARDLNRAGALARRAGLDFGYHNHQAEFVRQDGGSRTGYDILTGETDPDLVHLEVDLFWAWRGAADPVDLIERHRGRIRQVHVKDMDTAAASPTPAPASSTSAGSSSTPGRRAWSSTSSSATTPAPRRAPRPTR